MKMHSFTIKATSTKKEHEVLGGVLRADETGIWLKLTLDYITDGGATPCDVDRYYRWTELEGITNGDVSA